MKAKARELPTEGPFARPDRYAKNWVSPFWPSFVEKLVVAIVDAYPTTPPRSVSQQQWKVSRVNTALRALFGWRPVKGPSLPYDLPEAYDAFVNVDQKGTVALPDNSKVFGYRSEHTLEVEDREHWGDAGERLYEDKSAARRALAHSKGVVSFETLRGRIKDPHYRAYLIDVQSGRMHAQEKEMKEDLDAIATILGRWQVRFDVDPLRLALASYWGERGTDDAPPGEMPPT